MTREFVTLPREVVEQVLKAAEAFHSHYKRNIFSGCVHSEELHFSAARASLRAALKQHSSLTCKQDLQVPSGFVLLQTREGKPVYAACLDGGRFNGWLMWKHPDGQWISKRKLENWEIMQAEDQRDSGIVQGIDND